MFIKLGEKVAREHLEEIKKLLEAESNKAS